MEGSHRTHDLMSHRKEPDLVIIIRSLSPVMVSQGQLFSPFFLLDDLTDCSLLSLTLSMIGSRNRKH